MWLICGILVDSYFGIYMEITCFLPDDADSAINDMIAFVRSGQLFRGIL